MVKNVIVKTEKLSEDSYKLTYRAVKDGHPAGEPWYALVGEKECKLLKMRETLVNEYNVPVDFVDEVIDMAKEVQLEEVKEWNMDW